MVSEAGRGGPPGRDEDPAADSPPFSDEGMRRIVYGQDRERRQDGRSAAFAEDTAELAAEVRGRRSLLPVVVAVAALVCFGAIVWYAYSWGTGQMASDELPVVRAEPTPEKVKPEQPGGLEVPYQDKLVLNNGAPEEGVPRVERLLPPPEVPNPPAPLEVAREPASEAPAGSEPAQQAELPAQVPPAGEIPPPPSDSSADSPVGSSVAGEAADALPEPPAVLPEVPEAGDAEIARPLRKPEVSEERDQIAALLEQTPVETTNGAAATAEAEKAGASKQAAVQSAALRKGDVVLQLSSVKSQAAASKEWARLQKAHPGLLGELSLALDTAEVQGTTYYRVQTGPFASRSAADGVCSQLKARQQDCLVKQR